MKRTLLFAAMALMAVSIMSCINTPITVSSDYDQDYDFAKLKTFKFLDIPPESGINELDAGRLKRAVEKVMGGKGYTVSEQADFGVAMHFGVQEKTQIDTISYGYYGWGPGGAQVWQYDEGTLVIDFIDMEKNHLIWRGSGTKILSDNPSIDEKTKNINEAVTKILNEFPPTTK
jgi:hypothetical protein